MFKKNKTKGYPKPKKHKQSVLKRIMLSISYIGLGKERSAIIQNMAMMLDAGLQITDALATLSEESSKKPVKKVMRAVRRDVDNGQSLWSAMDRQAFFTPYSIAMIQIGRAHV